MTVQQIEILIEDGSELSKELLEKSLKFIYKVEGFTIRKKQFEDTYDKYKKRFNDNRTHGAELKHTFRINKDK